LQTGPLQASSSASTSASSSQSTDEAATRKDESDSDRTSVVETDVEQLAGNDDDTVHESRPGRSGARAWSTDDAGESEITPRRHRRVFTGHENDGGEQFLYEFLRTHGIPEAMIAIFKTSNRPNTFRSDRRALRLLQLASDLYGVNWAQITSEPGSSQHPRTRSDRC
jgi:hypothetical protein